MMAPAPPVWADTWLRLLLPARDRDTVSGDLMEEYREHIRPARSKLAADAWYVGQVSRFAWRVGAWALALAALYVGRAAFDWFVPTTNFAPRAEATTVTMISTLLVIGGSSTLRTQSVMSGIVNTASALVLAAVIDVFAIAFIYVNWNSPELAAAINASGGLPEAFTMPILMIVPGTLIGAIGAYIAKQRPSPMVR
jgi:hypothetical protein